MRREFYDLYQKRLAEFIARLARTDIYSDHAPVDAVCRVSDEPISFAERGSAPEHYRSITVGEVWGSAWQSAWFHLRGMVPADWRGHDVALRFDANGESLVFDGAGCPVYGLTNGSVFDGAFNKDLYRLWEPCEGGERLDLWIEAAAYGLFGIERDRDPRRDAPERDGSYVGKIVRMELVRFDRKVWHYWLDLVTLFDLCQGLEEHSPRRNRMLEVLSRSVDLYEVCGSSGVDKARAVLDPVMQTPPNPADLAVTAVGHAHIDVGWLWPVCESTRKAARTFASQIALLERYPDYCFGASQPALYEAVKRQYPALYDKIRQSIAAGRWECQGAMWVEADCNVTGGESLVRQILHGKNFYRDEFGVDVHNLWLPDVFGYSAALPQILRRAGVDMFLTQKLSWNQQNEFPFNTFRWRGIDGSEVLTHFPPENNYNGFMLPQPLMAAQKRFKENGVLEGFVSLFGIGDGGGGPKEEQVEQGMRLRRLNGAPCVTFGTAEKYFEYLRQSRDRLETWNGELYLECHRGTFTTQARTKRGNRKLELALRETEMFLSMLPLAEYPRDTLEAVWKVLLTHQFHDILPGSSIRRVYREAEQGYAEGLAACETMKRRAAQRLLRTDARAVTLFNSLGCVYSAPFRLDASWRGVGVEDSQGNEIAVQEDEEGLLAQVPLPPYSLVTLRRGKPRRKDGEPRATECMTLENECIRYEFASNAAIVRIYDKVRRVELLPSGAQGNLLSLYADRPHNYDAWEIVPWYREERIGGARATAFGGHRSGTVCDTLDFELAIGEKSTLRQRVRLARTGRRLDFETRVSWHEFHRMLRVSFDTGIVADEGACDIQYGYLRRPTHQNTSWDLAKFEVAAQRYVDLSDHQQGMALLNDCKYGYRLDGSRIDLNLLRAPTHPDPDADLGEHEFTYALLPHEGRLIDSDVMAESAMLNQPPAILSGFATGASTRLPCRLEAEGISMEVLKWAEREECLVVRLVETRGCRSRGLLHLHAGDELVETDLMEWKDGIAICRSSPLELELAPFEIRTYKIRRNPSDAGDNG